MTPRRRHPSHGVLGGAGPTVVLVTVCTKARTPWLANCAVHELLVATWRQASAWHVGRYVLMPDHLHLFATPGDADQPLDNGVRFWKSAYRKQDADPAQVQPGKPPWRPRPPSPAGSRAPARTAARPA